MSPKRCCRTDAGLWLAFLLIGMSSVGCRFQQPASNPLIAPVRGTITVNGKPQAKLQVYFHSASTRPSMAFTEEDGSYELQFDEIQKGASIGFHVVRITRNLQPLIDPRPELPSKYNEHSELKVQVKPGQNTFDFHLMEDVPETAAPTDQRDAE